MVIEGVERTIEADAQRLLIPRVEADSFWTNLPLAPRQCVGLYHDHGTSEQFHSELKSDMGIKLLPSGDFRTNALVLGVAAISYNCLRMVGQAVLARMERPSPSRELPQRLIREEWTPEFYFTDSGNIKRTAIFAARKTENNLCCSVGVAS